MDTRFNNHVIKLQIAIAKCFLDFQDAELNDNEDMSYVLNLILSAHISSLVHCLKCASEQNENAKNIIDEFIKELETFLRVNHEFRIVNINQVVRKRP